MANIRKLYEDDQTTQIMPQTHEKAVVDDNGTTLETKLGLKQDVITAVVNPTVTENGGEPSASVSFSNGQLSFEFSNLKGEQGEKGDTVILGDGDEYTLYNTVGSNTDGAMTQHSVTKELKNAKLPEVSEEGLYITDSYGNVGMKFDEDGLDVTKISEHFSRLVIPLSKRTHSQTVEEEGFYITDENGKVGMRYNKDGLSAAKLHSSFLDLIAEKFGLYNQLEGAKIAVCGGSFGMISESKTAKNIWKKVLHTDTVDTYAISATGFSLGAATMPTEQLVTGYYNSGLTKTTWRYINDNGDEVVGGVSCQGQVDRATLQSAPDYDVFILWCSTNDCTTYNQNIGTRDSYTAADSYDVSALNTQCGGMNYCIKKIYERNPQAQIFIFGTARFFTRDMGYNSQTSDKNSIGKCMFDYITAQKAVAEKWGIPYFDQWNSFNFNILNYSVYFQNDYLHPNTTGYQMMGYKQAYFLKSGIDTSEL